MIVNWRPAHPALRTLLATFLKQTTPVYVVGGAVRDYLLTGNTQPTDLDLVVTQAALPTAQRVANQLGWAYYPLDEARDTARLVFPNTYGTPLVCDVTSLRGGSIEADLLGRDFTVNALAFVLERGIQANKDTVQLLDVCHGQKDLANRVLRRVSATSFADDSVRLLRAVRFIYQLGFTLEAATLEQIKRAGESIRLASPERVRDELWKTLVTPAPAEAIELLRQLGLLPYVLPEVDALVGIEQSAPHHEDVYYHTLRVVQNAATLRAWLRDAPLTEEGAAASWCTVLQPWRKQLQQHFARATAGLREQSDWLIWFALLHDIGKPSTRSVEAQPDGTQRYRFLEHETVGARMAEERLTHLRLARHEINQSQTVIAHHMRPHLLAASFADQPLSRRAAYRFFRDTSGNQLDHPVGVEIILLALADFAAIQQQSPSFSVAPNWLAYAAHIQELLAFLFADERPWQQAHQQPLVDGHTLMARLKLAPGPQVGQLLEAVREAQAAGEIHTVDEAITLARAVGGLLAAPTG